MIISTADLLSLFEKAGQLDLSILVKDGGDGHYSVKLHEMFGKDFEELLLVDQDGRDVGGDTWGCGTVTFHYLMDRLIDALKERKQEELKQKRRKAILAKLTDEEKELLGIEG